MKKYVVYYEENLCEFDTLEDAIASAKACFRSYGEHSVVVNQRTGAVVFSI